MHTHLVGQWTCQEASDACEVIDICILVGINPSDNILLDYFSPDTTSVHFLYCFHMGCHTEQMHHNLRMNYLNVTQSQVRAYDLKQQRTYVGT